MGLFDFLKKKQREPKVDAEVTMRDTPTPPAPSEQPIPEDEKKYYQPDEYYTEKRFQGTTFASDVITFDERKKTAYPSRNGLYPAEILLLEYCKYGTYPNPKNGYPGFWWFKYGIRNVGAALCSLEDRGFLFLVAESGKSERLIYALTALGVQETQENKYVKYIHNDRLHEVDVWTMNRLIHDNPQTPWRDLLTQAVDTRLYQYDDAERFERLFLAGLDDKQRTIAIRRYTSIQRDLSSFRDAGIKRYIFRAMLEFRTCPVCGNLDGQDFAIDEACVGINCPPMHNGCRCFIGPYHDKEWLDRHTRSAQIETDKWGQVPQSMNWNGWYKQHVEGRELEFAEAERLKKEQYSYTANMPKVLNIIADNPGVLQKNLPELLPQLKKYVIIENLKNLIAAGHVIKKRSGSTYALYTAPESTPIK